MIAFEALRSGNGEYVCIFLQLPIQIEDGEWRSKITVFNGLTRGIELQGLYSLDALFTQVKIARVIIEGEMLIGASPCELGEQFYACSSYFAQNGSAETSTRLIAAFDEGAIRELGPEIVPYPASLFAPQFILCDGFWLTEAAVETHDGLVIQNFKGTTSFQSLAAAVDWLREFFPS